MTTKEYNKLLIEWELVQYIINKADEYGIDHSNPLMQYLFRKNICHPDHIVKMENRSYAMLEEDMLANSKPEDHSTNVYRVYKTKTETGYIDIRATSMEEAITLSEFKTQFYLPLDGTEQYTTDVDRTKAQTSCL